MFGKILFILFIICMVGIVSVLNVDKERMSYNTFMVEHKYIKEMSVDMTTKGEMSGGFLLIAGGFYGSINTQRELFVVYSTFKDGEMVYKVLTLSLDRIEIVTINKDAKPYFKITEQVYGNEIYRIKLYLPDGWSILTITK